jgi:hypothetical protein
VCVDENKLVTGKMKNHKKGGYIGHEIRSSTLGEVVDRKDVSQDSQEWPHG